VRDVAVLPLLVARRKITLLPAQRRARRAPVRRGMGRIRVGADADLTLFDPARVRERATWTAPALPPEGIDYVIVGGVPVVERGALRRDVRPGRAVRAPIR
jgi:N-acyl-D-aspartate/D-glutamate deacylase